MKKHLLLWLLCAVAAPLTTAMAQTAEQRAAIKHIAQASVLANHCSSLRLNSDRMLLIALTYKLGEGDPDNGPIAVAMRAARLKAEADAAPLAGQEASACAGALLMYGPSGKNVPGLLIAK